MFKSSKGALSSFGVNVDSELSSVGVTVGSIVGLAVGSIVGLAIGSFTASGVAVTSVIFVSFTPVFDVSLSKSAKADTDVTPIAVVNTTAVTFFFTSFIIVREEPYTNGSSLPPFFSLRYD